MRDVDTIPQAHGIVLSQCEHGNIHLVLVDEDGDAIAGGVMDEAGAIRLAMNITNLVEPDGDGIGEAEGNA